MRESEADSETPQEPGVGEQPPSSAAEPAEAQGSPAWALGLGHLVLVAFAGFFYLLLSYLPLENAALWGHVIYGEWIIEHQSLPAEDPIMPLAEGMPVVDTSWLSQVILAAVERAGGAEWLSRLLALLVSASMLFLGRAFFLLTGSLALSMLGTLAAVTLGWGRLTSFGSESFGVLAFAMLLWLITGTRASALGGESDTADRVRQGPIWRLWLGIPLLFVAWANLDASFVYGLVVLACMALGHAIDVGWRSGSPRAAIDDPTVRRGLYLAELAAAATLLNPYGIDLIMQHQLVLAASSNLLYVAEWQPLVMNGLLALGFALSFVALLFVFRHSRLRVPAAHGLLLAFFAFAAATAVGRMVWYGPIFVWVVAPHLAEIVARARYPARWRQIAEESRLFAGSSSRYTMLSATLLLIVFILSPIGSQALGRESRPLGQLLGSAPLELAGYLVSNPPRGQVFNPASWGDWLALQGPSGLRLFTSTNVHLLPLRVWESYRRISGAVSGWSRTLDRYRIDTVIVRKLEHQSLVGAIRFSEDWILAYEDDQAMVFERVSPPLNDLPVAATPEPAGGDPEERSE